MHCDTFHRRIRITLVTSLVCIWMFFPPSCFAGILDDIAFTELESELDGILPDTSQIVVSQVEGLSYGHFMPDVSYKEFAGKTILNIDGDTGVSTHATAVGSYFYGSSSSIAQDIKTIHAYYASNWMQASFLNAMGYIYQPLATKCRVANHSWVSTLPVVYTTDILRRLDWVVETDEYVNVVALPNGATATELLSHGYNIIAVGRTDGNHPIETKPIDSIYVSGRTLATVVCPMTVTSAATPVAASAATVLVALGHNAPSLSTGYTFNRSGAKIYNAERSEVIKAAIMAGADRFTRNPVNGNITDYRAASQNITDNGLDKRYGAGQLNIYHSYHIIAAGEQESEEEAPLFQGSIDFQGFDYDASFGGKNSSNRTARYYFTAEDDPLLLQASLVWNLDIDGGVYSQFNGAGILYNLDMRLFDITENRTLIAQSLSTRHNTEHIRQTLLSNHVYEIEITPGQGQEEFVWDYALAWTVQSDKDSDTIPDALDNCMLTGNPTQQDVDGDGIGNGCDCDLSNDGFVNMIDYVLFKKEWLKEGVNYADFNSDNCVNMIDFALFKKRNNTTAPWY